MNISFILPSMSRPAKFFKALDNIQEMCTCTNYEVVSIHERTDESMNDDWVVHKMIEYPFLYPYYHDCDTKVEAINKGVRHLNADCDVVILVADDIRFIQKGFDCLIEQDMMQHFPDFSGLLHYPDGISQVLDRQITMPVMGIKLVEHFGYIYHESYISMWCDNEQLAVTKFLKKHVYIDRKLFIHEHPAWGLCEKDELYKRNESFYHVDSANYFKRQAINFDL